MRRTADERHRSVGLAAAANWNHRHNQRATCNEKMTVNPLLAAAAKS
jgi:hypothetical protein